MPTIHINNWINEIQRNIDYWYSSYGLNPANFNITTLPNPPIINPNILNHNLTSCCPTPPKSAISFAHFPEPYYGNPDDLILKSAVILFFNPGPAGNDQLHGNLTTPNTFNHKYNLCRNNYFNLSSTNNFCSGTYNRFIRPKTNQINSVLSFVPNISEYNPLFMDIVPWHSDNFDGLDSNRFNIPATLREAKIMVFLPAILNALNTKITQYAKKFNEKKIILFCVGSKYSKENILSSIGFNDITTTIQLINNPFPNINPPNLPYTILNSNGDISVDSKSKIKVWSITGSKILDDIDVDQETRLTLNDKEIVILNVWNMARSMDIPQNIGPTIENIIQQI